MTIYSICGGSKKKKKERERETRQICAAISRKKEVDERKVVKNICHSALKNSMEVPQKTKNTVVI